jgi:hypothetical protein
MALSKSLNRHTFQRDAYIARCKKEGKPASESYLAMYENHRNQVEENESNDEWKKNNLEYDLRSTDWILAKVRGDDVYAQHLYAALCNNEFQQLDTWPILSGQVWHCSWRYAGGVIADMQERGDYIDWYCSGIRNAPTEEEIAKFDDEQMIHYKKIQSYVGEGFVTEEIHTDLDRLGWVVTKDE